MALECKVKSFEDGIFIGEIVNVNADDSIITDGKIDYKKLKPITYDPVTHDYVALGEAVDSILFYVNNNFDSYFCKRSRLVMGKISALDNVWQSTLTYIVILIIIQMEVKRGCQRKRLIVT